MYKLVIIDDEAVVRKSIIRKIQWEEYGFNVVGEAENGKEALEVIESTNPDLIITDIEMPFMNGMELASIVRNQYPTMKIVFLTGYDEFKYAQQAIELDVVEYILKPISSDNLINILIKIKGKLDEEINQKKNIENIREHYLNSIPVLKENFFNTLITAKQKREDILNKAEYYDINLNGSVFITSVISIDKNTINEEKFSEEDTELIKFAIFNTSKEIMDKYSLGIVFVHDTYIVLVTVSQEPSNTYIINKTFTVLEEIRQSIEKYMKFTVTIGIGSISTEVENIIESYKSALCALDYRFTIGNNKLIYIEDLEPQSFNKIVFDDKKEHTLVSSIKFGTEKDVFDTIENLFADLVDVKASFSDYQIYLLEMLAAVVRVSKDLKLDIQTIFGRNYNLFLEMFKFNTIEEVKEWFKSTCSKLMTNISRKRQNSSVMLVEKAKEYIKENFNDHELSLDKVSSYLHISPNYFGSIFKNETKETFVSFLLKTRMESAKDLICATKMKNFEVAGKVGYADEHYFSYSFKKYFKISPNEFRKVLIKK